MPACICWASLQLPSDAGSFKARQHRSNMQSSAHVQHRPQRRRCRGPEDGRRIRLTVTMNHTYRKRLGRLLHVAVILCLNVHVQFASRQVLQAPASMSQTLLQVHMVYNSRATNSHAAARFRRSHCEVLGGPFSTVFAEFEQSKLSLEC